jgi:hypothetical protein
MGRYAEIKLATEADVPKGEALLVARMSWIGHGIVAVFLLIWAIGVPVFLLNAGIIDFSRSLFNIVFSGFIVVFVGIAALIGFLAGVAFLSSALAALRSSNWTFLATKSGIYLKLRNYGDFRLPADDRIIAFIPKREIRKLSFHHQKNRKIADNDTSDDTQLIKDETLIIKLYGNDLAKITDTLTAERLLYGPSFIKGVRTRAKGASISVPDGSSNLQVDWKTRRTRLTPSLRQVEKVLEGLYQMNAVEGPDEAPIRSLKRSEQENRLREMIRRGDMIDAATLARDLYGLTLTEAKSFLKNLEA